MKGNMQHVFQLDVNVWDPASCNKKSRGDDDERFRAKEVFTPVCNCKEWLGLNVGAFILKTS